MPTACEGGSPLFHGLACAVLAVAGMASAQDAAPRRERYLADYDYIVETVAAVAAAPAAKGIDWKRAAAALRPRLEACADDVTHVRNCKELLALLRDGHSGIMSHGVDAAALPSKWDGLHGAGLRLDHDRGQIVLAGLVPGHPCAEQIAPGDLLVEIDGLPAWLAMEREKRRIERFHGQSSDHFLFATLADRFLPFGARDRLACRLWRPGAPAARVELPRAWPGARPWSGLEQEGPRGVERGAGVASVAWDEPWGRVGYLRILGKMDAPTVRGFHAALDAMRGIDGLVLDCRGMGGGGDDPAWELAGRFLPQGAANGVHGRIEPSGAWQLDGPVVMLQDAREASSAETFTWAMSETGRVLAIGQRTAGMAIIPRRFEAPSGLFTFRVGVNDRPTPIGGIRTEGEGFPPDLPIALGPGLGAQPRALLEIGVAFLRAQKAGVSLAQAKELAALLARGELRRFEADARRLLDGEEQDALAALAGRFRADLEARLAAEVAALEDAELPMPFVAGAAARLAELEPAARAAGLAESCVRARKALRALAAEERAQQELLALLDATFGVRDREAAAAFGRRHARTRTAEAARPLLP